MAGYHLCRHETAERPFFIKSIQVMIWSAEELAYFLCHFPALVDEQVMCHDLIQWVSADLNLPRTAERMESARKEGSSMNFALYVLRETGIIDSKELSKIIASYEKLDAMKPVARKKASADALLRYGKLTAAIDVYRSVQDELLANGREPELLAAAWHDRGVAEMRLMLFDEGLESFRMAMHIYGDIRYRVDFLSALLITKPYDKREEEIEREHISDEELLNAEEIVAGARTESREKSDVAFPPEYLATLTAAYHQATGF